MKRRDEVTQTFDKAKYNEPTDQEIYERNRNIIKSLEKLDIRCIVPISGGKDSQSCLKLAIEKFGKNHVLGMFCDTGFEHPLTYNHIEKIKEMYGVTIIHLQDGDVYSKVKKHGRFPSDIARFCTDQLKINVGKKFYKQFSEWKIQNSVDKYGNVDMFKVGFEVWYGMRLGESWQRSERYKDKTPDDLSPPHEIMVNKYPKYLAKMGVMFRLPILRWEEEDVYEFLEGEMNDLYSKGFDRVGCFPCLASGDKWKEAAFNFDEVGKERRIKIIQLGHEIGKNIFTTKGGRMRNPDADPNNTLDVEYNPNQDEMSPCFHCNI